VSDLEPATADELAEVTVELWAARDAAMGAEAAAGQLRARVKELEAELDAHRRHVDALVAEVASLRGRLAGLEVVAAHRDAMLRSPTWRVGTLVMRPVNALRRRPAPS
jgi:chromosome segregation ATPase